MTGVFLKDRIINNYIRRSLEVAVISDKMKEHRLQWFCHVTEKVRRTWSGLFCRCESRIRRGRASPKLIWEQGALCGIDGTLAEDRRDWKGATHRPDLPTGEIRA